MELIKQSFQEARELLDNFISDENNLEKIRKAAEIILNAYSNQGTVFSCGNGGSLCDAMHFAEELTGRFRKNRKPFSAIAIADPSHITCVGNDYGFDFIFSRYLEANAEGKDVLLAISTSGNSPNILQAVKAARAKNMQIIGLTGKDGGKLKETADVCIHVPWMKYSDRIQEIHIKIIHILIEYIEDKIIH